MAAIANRYDFALIFDVVNGNPNGDPDAGNMPRIDPETYQGLMSDVSIKRKIRNYVQLAREGEEGFNIYVEEGAILNDKHREAYRAIRKNDPKVNKDPKLNPKDDNEAKQLVRFMNDNFYDVRTFGAVMSTGVNCGQVKGPVQVGFARSVEPIMPLEISITRMAATNEAEKKEKQSGEDAPSEERKSNQTMGRKYIVPYGLYVVHGYISAKFAERSGFSDQDLELLIEALQNMFEHDRSAARGEMSVRKLVVFKHENVLGNAPAHKLFDLIKVQRSVDGEQFDIGAKGTDGLPSARSFSDYAVSVNTAALPEGVTVIEKD
jgi:CRISPR-associated protein Csd2